MTKILSITAILATICLVGCGTTNTTTTTKYDTDGKVTETIVVESETSDLTAYINAGDGNVTSLNGDISKFKLGYADVGLSWFSISGGRQKAPVNTDSNSAEALEQISEVVKATKTSIITETLAINSDLSTSADAADTSAQPTDATDATKIENLTTSTPINNEVDANLTNVSNDTNTTNDTNNTNLSTVEQSIQQKQRARETQNASLALYLNSNNKTKPTTVSDLINKDIEHLSKRIEALERTIYGNGQKGLKAELIELKTEINTFKKIAVWQIGILVSILGVLIKLLI